jgi:hypothetical protein
VHYRLGQVLALRGDWQRSYQHLVNVDEGKLGLLAHVLVRWCGAGADAGDFAWFAARAALQLACAADGAEAAGAIATRFYFGTAVPLFAQGGGGEAAIRAHGVTSFVAAFLFALQHKDAAVADAVVAVFAAQLDLAAADEKFLALAQHCQAVHGVTAAPPKQSSNMLGAILSMMGSQ